LIIFDVLGFAPVLPPQVLPSACRIALFVVYPLILAARALQYRQESEPNDQQNRQLNLYLLVCIFLLFSLTERLLPTFESRFYMLTLIAVAAVALKEKGLFEKGLQKVIALINKTKTP
jgi:hypothetical protein